MECMPEPLQPSQGWGVLHLFCATSPYTDRHAVTAAVESAFADGYQALTFAVLGHKADLGFMALGPDLWRLRRFQTELQAGGLEILDSFVSMTELSEYNPNPPEELLRDRLNPQLPPDGMRVMCFYPMSKRRGDVHNWYATDFEDRKQMMYDHGVSGRKFTGRVLQVVTGSTGVDDWEWGVTLFAHDPADLKACVYTLRFDAASAHYGEFGTFITGLLDEPAVVLDQVLPSV